MIHEWDSKKQRWDVQDMKGKDVFWTDDATYILGKHETPNFRTPNGEEVILVSINGGGRPRWAVSTRFCQGSDKAAVNHFGLKPL